MSVHAPHPAKPTSRTLGLALSLTLAVLATLALLPAIANAYVYWANYGTGTIARANLDGSHVDKRLITGVNRPRGVAVDALEPLNTKIESTAVQQNLISALAEALEGAGLRG